MAQQEIQRQVIEAWLQLPETRRQHATDAVAFAFRVLQDRPELLQELKDAGHEMIVNWLLPYLAPEGARP